MSVKVYDTITPASTTFPAVMAEHVNLIREDGTADSIQNLFNNKELGGGGDSSVTLTQEEYELLGDEERFNGLYYTYDTKRIYKNGIQYGANEPLELTMAEFKALKEAGVLDEQQEYIITTDENGVLLEASDIGYNGTASGLSSLSVQEAIDEVNDKVDNLIDDEVSDSTVWSSKKTSDEIDALISDTNLTSTTSTLSASKVKNAVTYNFDTQAGSVKYVKFKLNITTISIVDNYGGKIEILGANNSPSNPNYKTAKVVRLSYGDWNSHDATQVPSAVHTKIGELYYYSTDEYYYLKLYNYAAFTITGLATAPEVVASLPVEESEMTLIPESAFAYKSDLDTKGLVANAQSFKIDLTKNNAYWYGMFTFSFVYGATPCEITVTITNEVYYTITKGQNVVSAITYTQDGANYTIGIDFTAKIYGTQVVEMPSEFGVVNSFTAETYAGDTTANLQLDSARTYTTLAELGLTTDATFQNVISALPKGGSALLGVKEFTNYQTIFPYEDGNDQFARIHIVKGVADGSSMYARWFRKDGIKEAIAIFNINDNKFVGWQKIIVENSKTDPYSCTGYKALTGTEDLFTLPCGHYVSANINTTYNYPITDSSNVTAHIYVLGCLNEPANNKGYRIILYFDNKGRMYRINEWWGSFSNGWKEIATKEYVDSKIADLQAQINALK